MQYNYGLDTVMWLLAMLTAAENLVFSTLKLFLEGLWKEFVFKI